jgi:hypothetical protein
MMISFNCSYRNKHENEWMGVTLVLQAISNAGRTAQLKTLISKFWMRETHGKFTQWRSSQGTAVIANVSCVHRSGDRRL